MELFRYIHSWFHDTIPIVFFTVPMIHIGEKKFYSEVNELIKTKNHILCEGIKLGKNFSELGKYELLAEKVDLVTQYTELKIPKDAISFNVDMSEEKITEEIKGIGIINRIKLKLLDRKIKKIEKNENLKVLLKESFKYPKSSEIELINPKKHYQFVNREKSKIDLLIRNNRDNTFQENIKKYIENNKQSKNLIKTGIIIGDSHMPAIYRVLEELNFKWKLEKKIFMM